MSDVLQQQVVFLREVDRLKSVQRMTTLGDRSRRENSAEHSWHIALMASTLASHRPEGVDVDRVIRMLLIHDLVEIDAGDTFAFDAAANHDKAERERAAAERLFGLIGGGPGPEFRRLWEEFEAGDTPDARMANALDRFAALLQNTAINDGGTWRAHGVSKAAVLRRMDPIREGLPALWPLVLRIIDEQTAAGHLTV
ncbi:MAG: HD domain-containing protein [Acidimicrobiia bacterium]|nr:HD domain-containing protein [Acidimicrobiia bacterium]